MKIDKLGDFLSPSQVEKVKKNEEVFNFLITELEDLKELAERWPVSFTAAGVHYTFPGSRSLEELITSLKEAYKVERVLVKES